MTGLAVPQVERPAVGSVQALHSGRNVGLGRAHEQVVVRGHEAVREARPAVTRDGPCDDRLEALPVAHVAEQRPPGHGPPGEVVERVGGLDAQRTGHLPQRRVRAPPPGAACRRRHS